ncbi:reverse transcriptase [Gossypium australe]|uniref:Reverse transcriptase n=1 Tax=Gossypium australe TaxID=47621 RepID=A0A5B6WUX5_9ROSI|nr:reverse transcriptase [Gossypium australe]
MVFRHYFFRSFGTLWVKMLKLFFLGILNDGKDFDSLNLTVIYKIVAKTIANRLQEFIGRCIDNAQSAFVPGRLISNNVLLAYEILHTLSQKRTGKKGFMAVKLDMSKAYDRVE